ncbi:outer membrane protein assembly factor BamB [Candidatus Aalborgicola defluviihabitans]|jgi:outer membrane assembly lipoprotein YfgL|uniref:outer membrane protein assembly factor BamB n=1 Tax=Candidatus Aalborgicola defluviihabitans TaxID=3386187 RepID=UPI001DADF234|nr:outer membrane protein assembly factor BamB [Burkholderiales bacterium]MBK6567848.1 outer membrane protein assembly factor BamB [Burkholderiales bacterium]MBK7282108.1 outer membrane protein assembly factor BamB [Burkholderiales bacterium]MBK7313233.1 outer membrane protein assembly factor BamB [Burkholderiales bacterium]MBL0244509.1 outer membrane protein assembly factor BamB [Rhodoferax sp.]
MMRQLWSKPLRGLAVVVGLVVTLAGCSGPEKAKPLDLGPNTALIGVRSAWSSSIGTVGFPLEVRSVGNLIYVAGSDGTVAAIDARTGGDLWRTALGVKLSAGVGSDGRYVSVVSNDNELITLDANKEIWRQKLGALTLTAPLVAGARVFVLSADRSVTAFDVATGRRLWQQQRTGEALVLRRSGLIMAVGDTLVVGLGGRLVGFQPLTGKVRWEAQVANSRGTNEVERLVDLVAGVSREGNQVCVRSFQSAVGCVDAATGNLLWSKTASGAAGVDGDESTLFGTESDGRVVAWRHTDGERQWVSERLRFRGLSAPVLAGRSLVIGDEEGTLHFLSRQDGAPLNRLSTDGSAIVTTPVLAGQTLVAVTKRGGIFGFKPE